MTFTPSRKKGFILAFVATLALANVYIFSKAAMQQISLSQFLFWWFGMAVLWNGLFTLYTDNFKTIQKFKWAEWRVLLATGSVELIATSSIFSAIKTIDNPSLVPFIRNVEPIFVTIAGVFFLHERFGRKQVIGMILTLLGAFLVSFKGFTSIHEIFIPGSGLVILAAAFYTFRTTLVKHNVHRINPAILSLNHAVFIFLLATVLMVINHQALVIPGKAILNITIGSFLGPFLVIITSYHSLKHIEASTSTIIQSTSGLFVIIGSFLYFGLLPAELQVLGGLITITGVILISGVWKGKFQGFRFVNKK